MKEVVFSHSSNADSTLPETPSNSVAMASVDDDRMKGGSDSADALKEIAPNHSRAAVINGFNSAANGNVESRARSTADGTGDEGQPPSHGLESADLKPLVDVGLSSAELKSGKEWNVTPNPRLFGFNNPIRRITDALVLNKTNGKELLSLAAGDPAQFGPHMKVPEVASSALIKVLQDGKHNGYTQSFGLLECRSALADYLSVDGPYKLTPQEVAMTVGAAQALHLTINAFVSPGCNILLPRPGFPLYVALCKYFDAEPRYYDLLEDRNYEVDLDQIAAITDDNTAAMVLCNPGNPSGAVFRHEHLTQIATLAGDLKVPIISDEVYSSLVFGENPFVSMAQFSSIVPVLAIGGISKGWLATGWRLGWVGIWDPNGILKKAKVLEALMSIMQITSGPSTPIQAAVPLMLKSTPASFYEQTRESLRSGADLCFTRANKIQGLYVPCRPEGSMFMMVKVDLSAFKGMESDVAFIMTLLKEESVLVLPGSAFGRPNWFRIVFALSVSQLAEAWDRIEGFCNRYIL